MNNEEKLFQLVANVFETPIEDINFNSSKDSVPNWDSVHQIFLIISLEEVFNIHLSDDDAIQLLNVQLIKIILEEKGIQF